MSYFLKEREGDNLGVILKMSYFLKEREGDNLQMVIFQELRKWIFGNDGEALEILKRSEKSPFHETHNLKTQVLGTGPKTRVFILLI